MSTLELYEDLVAARARARPGPGAPARPICCFGTARHRTPLGAPDEAVGWLFGDRDQDNNTAKGLYVLARSAAARPC